MRQEILRFLPKDEAGRPPVLFVHGAYSGAWIWEHFLGLFAERGYRAYALIAARPRRQRGGSRQRILRRLRRTTSKIAVRAIGDEPILVGHSMGGLVSSALCGARRQGGGNGGLASAPPSGLRSSALHMTMFAPDVLFQLSLLQSLGPKWAAPTVIGRALFSTRSTPESREGLLQGIQRESPLASARIDGAPSVDAARRRGQAAGLRARRRRRRLPAAIRDAGDRRRLAAWNSICSRAPRTD